MGRRGLDRFGECRGKHILFLTHYFPPEVNAPASRTYEHAKRWVRKGVRVTVITNNPNHPSGKLYPGYKNRLFFCEQLDGISVVRVKTYLTPNAGFWRRTVNHLCFASMAIAASFRIKGIDTVIATSPQFFCGLAGCLVSEIKKRPFILEVRDLWPDALIALEVISSKMLIWILRRLEYWMYHSAAAVVTTSLSQKELIVQAGLIPQKVFVIPNSVDLELFDSEKSSVKKGGTFPGRFLVSYIGTFGRAHGLEVVLAAAQLLEDQPDIHLILVGDGEERETIVRKARQLQLDNLTILPLQPKERVVDFISMSDIGIVPMRNISLFQTMISAKIFEYAALKKPIILATGQGEGANIVKKHNCGLVIEPENSIGLKEAIQQLYNDKDLRDRLGENGLRIVRQHYNRELMAEEMLKVMFPGCGREILLSAPSLRPNRSALGRASRRGKGIFSVN